MRVSEVNHHYLPLNDRVYYITPLPPGGSPARERRVLDLATRMDRLVRKYDINAGAGLSGSQDGKTILVGGSDPTLGTDLMVIRNFR